MINLQKPLLGMKINRKHPLAKGLVGYWVFNERSGNKVFDLSGNGNNGTIHGADWVTDGLDFVSADSNYIEVCDGKIDNGTQGTIIVKLNITTLNEIKILGYGGSASPPGGLLSFDIRQETNYYFSIVQRTIEDSTVTGYRGTTSLSTDTYEVAFVSNGSEWKIYINGIEESLIALSFNQGTNNGLWFGDTTTDGVDKTLLGALFFEGAFTGYIDATISYSVIYNRALTAAEINALNIDPYQMFRRKINPCFYSFIQAPSGWIGRINNITNPAKIQGVTSTNISKVMGV